MSSVITVENLSKKYIIGHQKQERYTTLRDVLANGAKRLGTKLLSPFTGRSSPMCERVTAQPLGTHRPPPCGGTDSTHEEFWALKDVSFDIQQGDREGIIGRNSAGKTTLLQLICATLNLTNDSIKTNDRIVACAGYWGFQKTRMGFADVL